MRSTREVIEDHLALRREHDLGADVERNYADDLLVMAKDGVFRGKDGIRKTARILQENLPDATYRYELLRVADDYALLGWSATAANGARTRHGADAFVVKDGLIAVQIIHYDVAPPDWGLPMTGVLEALRPLPPRSARGREYPRAGSP